MAMGLGRFRHRIVTTESTKDHGGARSFPGAQRPGSPIGAAAVAAPAIQALRAKRNIGFSRGPTMEIEAVANQGHRKPAFPAIRAGAPAPADRLFLRKPCPSTGRSG